MDIQAAKKRCEAAIPEPWTFGRHGPDVEVMSGQTVIASMGDFYPEADFVTHARSDLPAALEALEEAQAGADKAAAYWEQRDEALNERDEAQGKLEAVREWADKFPLSQIRERRYELDAILGESK